MADPLRKAIDKAVSRIVRQGVDGPPPVDDLDALRAHGDALEPALRTALETVDGRRLEAFIHLLLLLRMPDFGDAVAEVALRRPAPIDAKAAALELLYDSGVQVPEAVETTLETAQGFLAAPDQAGFETILAMPDSWRIPVLRAWLADDAPASPEMIEQALGVAPEVDAAVVDRLGASGSAEAVPILHRLRRAGDRDLQKASKRALHRLRTAGVDVDEPEAGEPAAFSLEIEPDVRGESSAYVTGVDGVGGRILWMITPWRNGGFRLLEAVLSDQEGVRKAEVLAVTRKEFGAHVKRLRSTEGLLVAQVEPAQAVAMLRAAEETRSRATLPERYRSWRDEVASALFEEPGDPLAELATRRLMPGVESSWREALADAVELLGDPAFGSWAHAGEHVEAAAREVRAAETSQLALDEEQRKTQIDRAIAGVAESFDSAARALYRGRLVESAAVLLLLRRESDARRAMAAGIGFSEVANLYDEHPFARAMIQRGVLAAYQRLREEEERAGAGSNIVRP